MESAVSFAPVRPAVFVNFHRAERGGAACFSDWASADKGGSQKMTITDGGGLETPKIG